MTGWLRPVGTPCQAGWCRRMCAAGMAMTATIDCLPHAAIPCPDLAVLQGCMCCLCSLLVQICGLA